MCIAAPCNLLKNGDLIIIKLRCIRIVVLLLIHIVATNEITMDRFPRGNEFSLSSKRKDKSIQTFCVLHSNQLLGKASL